MQKMIRSKEDMERLIEAFGFLPFFENGIPQVEICRQCHLVESHVEVHIATTLVCQG